MITGNMGIPLDIPSFTFIFRPLVQGSPGGFGAGTEVVEAASRTVSLLLLVLLLALVIPIVFIVYRKLLHSSPRPAPVEPDPRTRAAKLEADGDFVAAAEISEQSGNFAKAAYLYEKGKDYGRAAFMFERGGDLEKAAALYLKSGGSARAAGLYVKMGKYLEAARIFRNKGDHLRAAKAFELFGNKAAAAREYRESGQFERAARLMKEEGMFADAAETYGLSMQDETLDHSNVPGFYTYAALLALAGEKEQAAGFYHQILLLKGDFRKARGNLRALGYDEQGRPLDQVSSPPREAAETPPQPSAPEAAGDDSPPPLPRELDDGLDADDHEEDALRKETTLRSMIAYGRLDPKYGMRLWIQIMRALAVRHGENDFFGCLTPDAVRIDMQNQIEIDPPDPMPEVYTAPEVLAGQAPGPHSDVYAMGVILFEIVTGSLEHLGEKRPSENTEGIPEWLDALVVKCTKKDRRDRYLNTDDISASLVQLKKSI